MMERIVELYRSAYEGLRYDPKGYFEKDFPLLDDKLLNIIFFAGFVLYSLLATLAISIAVGGAAGGIASAIFSAIFVPIPAAIGMAIFCGYVLLACNMFFGQPTTFPYVWKFGVGTGALLMPVAIVSSILSFIPVIGLLASLAYTVLAAIVAYWAFRYYLKLTLTQIILLHVPVFVIGLFAVMISFMMGATLFVASHNVDRDYRQATEQLKKLNSELAQLERKQPAKSLKKSKKTTAKQVDQSSDDQATDKAQPTFRAGERYVYKIVRKKKGKKETGVLIVKFKKKTSSRLQATVFTRMGKKKEKETLTLRKDSSHYELFSELTKSMAKKKKPRIKGYDDLVTSFFAAHTGVSSQEEKSKREGLRKISSSMGLMGTAYADNNKDTPKFKGKVKVADRKAKKFVHKLGKNRSIIMTDEKLPLPIVAMDVKEKGSRLKIKLKKYKGKY